VAATLAAAVLCTLALALAGSASASGPVVDGHHHVALAAAGGVLDASEVESLKERGIQVAVVVLPLERSPTADLAARITDEVEALRGAAGSGSGFSISDSPTQLLAGAPEGEVRLLLSIEWFGDIFGRDPSRVRRYRELGVRIIGLAEQGEDPLFEDGSASLTPFGRRVLTALNDAGVLIDITHLSHPQKLAAIAASRAPVLATHALVREVTPVAFNLPDEVVDALAESGGSVWVSFNRSDLLGDGGESDRRAVEVLADHVDALVARLGHDRVGVGTDLQAGGRYVPVELNSPDTFARIRDELTRRGYSSEQADAILGGNVLRVLAAAD
jgi:membrane dipeptidase